MGKFPQPQFTFERNDSDLIEYLTKGDVGRFTFLREKTRKKTRRLNATRPLGEQLPILSDLWPMIIVDALLLLKKNDEREVGKNKGGEDYSSFFHEQSLGVEDLKRVLTSFTQFEGMLYGASPDSYRDHIAHAFKVWISGHGLLQECLEGTLDVPGGEGLEKEISSDEWACMWAIAALCHDLGYPLTNMERVNERSRDTLRKLGLLPAGDLNFGFSQQIVPFYDTMIRLMASKPVAQTHAGVEKTVEGKITAGEQEKQDTHYLTHLQNKYYLKLLKSFDRLDHGVVSALLISKALVYFLESDLCHDRLEPLTREDARQFLIRREILRSISAHTCQDIYHLNFATLSFLLYMVDEMQCWGRPTLAQLQGHSPGRGEVGTTVETYTRDVIKVTIHTKGQPWHSGQNPHTERITRRLNQFHRMFRLGVETHKLRKEQVLDYKVTRGSRDKARFLLRSRKITKTPKKWFRGNGN